MIYLDCSGLHSVSAFDEKHLFEWVTEIQGVLWWEQDTLVVRTNLSQASLRDLIAACLATLPANSVATRGQQWAEADVE